MVTMTTEVTMTNVVTMTEVSIITWEERNLPGEMGFLATQSSEFGFLTTQSSKNGSNLAKLKQFLAKSSQIRLILENVVIFFLLSCYLVPSTYQTFGIYHKSLPGDFAILPENRGP